MLASWLPDTYELNALWEDVISIMNFWLYWENLITYFMS